MAEQANAAAEADATDIDNNDVESELESLDATFESDEPTTEAEELESESEDEADELEESDDGEAEDESESEVEVEETDSEETQEEAKAELDPEEQRKEHNRLNAERRLQEKAQREAQIAQQADQYIEEAADDTDRALRQVQVEVYNSRVEKNTNQLSSAYERAIKDFEVLRDESPEVQAEVDQAIDAFQAMHVEIDALGNPSKVKADFYDYLKNKADSITKLTGKGALQQQKSKTREKAKTLTRPTRAPRSKNDPGMDAFEEEASRW